MFHDKAKRTQQGNLLPVYSIPCTETKGKGKFLSVSVMVLSMKTTIEKDITIKNEDVDDSRITCKGALPGKYRPLIVGSDVQAEEGEDQDGGGPAQPCQGGRGG